MIKTGTTSEQVGVCTQVADKWHTVPYSFCGASHIPETWCGGWWTTEGLWRYSVCAQFPAEVRVLYDVGRKRRGTVPAVYVKAAASVHRHILQQLEKMQLIEPDQENG